MNKLLRLAAALGFILVLTAVAACAQQTPTNPTPTPTPKPLSTCVKQSSNTTQVNEEGTFISNYVGAPFTGAARVTNAVFSNIYLWPDPGSETWDQHLASLPQSGSSNETSEVLDDITCALVNSSYFDPATQYGIAPPVYGGDEMTAQSCVDTVMQNAASNGGVIQGGAVKDFVNCEQLTGGGTATQVNIFVSPDLKVADSGKSVDICTTIDAAYHDWYLGARNWTVIPTDTRCNGSVATLTDSLSHEMVETITDPGGFGWQTKPFQGKSSQEVADICESGGQYPTSSVPFDDPTAGVGQLYVAPYWSDRDNSCEPKFIMNQTLATQTGVPIIQFTGQNHNLRIPVTISPGTADQVLQALEIEITTGGDPLRGGLGSEDNAIVSFDLRSGRAYAVRNINESNAWGSGTLHTAFLSFPPGITVGEVHSVILGAYLSGGDTWSINGIVVKAAVSSQVLCSASATLVNVTGFDTLSDGTTGLVRMTGSVHTWSTTVASAGTNANRLVTELQLLIETGGDDLRGGSSPSDNADAIIRLSSGEVITLPNINGYGHWLDYSGVAVDLTLPNNTTLGDISGLTVQTSFGGGISGDNWDIDSVMLQASVGCPAPLDATFISQNMASVLQPSQTFKASVTMENTGSNAWPAGNSSQYKLETQNPLDNTTWGLNSVAPPTFVPPGASVTFTFTVTAPSQPGIYYFQWRMVDEKGREFGDFTPNTSVLVGRPATVPDLIGRPLDCQNSKVVCADLIAQQAGFTTTIIGRNVVKGLKESVVDKQYPAPRTLAPYGSTIDIVIDIPPSGP